MFHLYSATPRDYRRGSSGVLWKETVTRGNSWNLPPLRAKFQVFLLNMESVGISQDDFPRTLQWGGHGDGLVLGKPMDPILPDVYHLADRMLELWRVSRGRP